VTPAALHNFFIAAAGVAGALIGLLFVAVSVAHERLTAEGAEYAHQAKAAAALTSFTNALSIALLALVPGVQVGEASVIIGGIGLLFVVSLLLSFFRVRKAQPVSLGDLVFLAGLVVTFGLEVSSGLTLVARGHDRGAADTIAIVVVVGFLIGISRAWELVGGPSFALFSEARALFVSAREPPDDADSGV
jgi:hypothetical protein